MTIYRLVARGTIEDQILALHCRKLAASVLEGSDAGGRMSADELLDLVRAAWPATRVEASEMGAWKPAKKRGGRAARPG